MVLRGSRTDRLTLTSQHVCRRHTGIYHQRPLNSALNGFQAAGDARNHLHHTRITAFGVLQQSAKPLLQVQSGK